jgi:hypothetical protein
MGVPETSDKSTTFAGTVLLHDPGGFAPTLKSVPAARHNMDVGMAMKKKPNKLEILTKLQKGLNLTPAQIRKWAREVRAERRAASNRLEGNRR